MRHGEPPLETFSIRLVDKKIFLCYTVHGGPWRPTSGLVEGMDSPPRRSAALSLLSLVPSQVDLWGSISYNIFDTEP